MTDCPTWTDERVELLRALWHDGLSASQIAADLGGVSRSAVIGKLYRLGLQRGRPKPAPARARATKAAVLVKPARTLQQMAAVALDPALAAAEPQPLATVVPMTERVTLMMLTAQACRWPMGDPGSEAFSFCGKRTDSGVPYCAAHARIAYQPADDRRDRRRAV